MAGDYVRGEMEISAQKGTFDGFIAVSVWGSLITGLCILYLTMVFAVGQDWMGWLIGTAVLGVVSGLVLKMKTAWYMTVAFMFITGLVTGGVVNLFGMFLA